MASKTTKVVTRKTTQVASMPWKCVKGTEVKLGDVTLYGTVVAVIRGRLPEGARYQDVTCDNGGGGTTERFWEGFLYRVMDG